MNADVVIWGESLCDKEGKICYYSKALFTHDVYINSTIKQGILNQTQIVNTNLPTLIGIDANSIVEFIIGWTFLENKKYIQYGKAADYFEKAISKANENDVLNIIPWGITAATYGGNYELALQWFNLAEQELIEKGKSDKLGSLYNNVSITYGRMNNEEKAIEYMKKAIDLAELSPGNNSLSTYYNNLGSHYYDLGNFEKAVEYHESALVISERMGSLELKAHSLGHLGTAYLLNEDWETALQYLNRAKNIYLDLNSKEHFASTLANISTIYGYQGNYSEALELYPQVLSIFISIGDSYNQSRILLNMGSAAKELGEIDKADLYYRKAIRISENLNDQRGLVMGRINLAETYVIKDKCQDAIDILDDASNLFSHIESLAYYSFNLALADVYSDCGYFREAINYYKISASLSLRHDLIEEAGYDFSNIGTNYYYLGDIDSSLYYYNKSAELALNIEDKSDLIIAYSNIISVHAELRDWREAYKYGKKIYEITKSTNKYNNQLADAYNTLAVSHILFGIPDSALVYLDKAMPLYKELGEEEYIGIALNNYGAAYKALEEYEEAKKWFEKSEEYNSNLLGEDAWILGYTHYHLAEIAFISKEIEQAKKHISKSYSIRTKLNNPAETVKTELLMGKIFQ